MITDLDETLKQLLIKEMPIENNEVDIKFDLPKRNWAAKLSQPPPSTSTSTTSGRTPNCAAMSGWCSGDRGARPPVTKSNLVGGSTYRKGICLQL